MFTKNIPVKNKDNKLFVIKEMLGDKVILINEDNKYIVIPPQQLDNMAVASLYDIRSKRLEKWFINATNIEIDDKTLKNLVGEDTMDDDTTSNIDNKNNQILNKISNIEKEIIQRVKNKNSHDDSHNSNDVDNHELGRISRVSGQMSEKSNDTKGVDVYVDKDWVGKSTSDKITIDLLLSKVQDWEDTELKMKIKLPISFVKFLANTNDDFLYDLFIKWMINKGILQQAVIIAVKNEFGKSHGGEYKGQEEQDEQDKHDEQDEQKGQMGQKEQHDT